MKDEIKEKLDNLRIYAGREENGFICDIEDYITNLQEENKRLNNIINELEKYLRTICIGDTTFEEIGITQSILNKLKELKEGK